MTVLELLSHLTRVIFMGLSIVTAAGYIEHRDSIRRDIFLTFLSLTGSMWMQLFTQLTGVVIPGQGLLAQCLLMTHPLLMVRLVRYFRYVPSWLYKATIISTIVSYVVLIVLGTDEGPLVTIVLIGHFAVFDGYAVTAFIYGAFDSAGVVRQRLRFAAAGSILLLLALIMIGSNVVAPSLRDFTMPMVQFLAILCAIAYFLGFAPPRWLRQAWQHAELREYLQQVQLLGNQTSEEMLEQLSTYVKRGLGTNVMVTQVALRNRGDGRLRFLPPIATTPIDNLPLDRIVSSVDENPNKVVVYNTKGHGAAENALPNGTGIESILAVPISVGEENLGVLAVGLQHGSLFVDEDVALLKVFAQQAGIIMQNHALVTELYERNVNLEQKVAERTVDLKRSNEELKMFAYVASHDLQEPLRTISSYLQLIESRYKDKLDDEGLEFIDFAVDGAARMKELIQDILTYSRVETTPKNYTTFESEAVVNEVCKFLETAINEAQAIVTCTDLPTVTADRRLMVQLFQNLLSNAVKYRGEGKPEINVCAARDGDSWQFSISDNGIGIEPQYLDQIFVVFRRLHHRGTYQGTGIGLAICKKAIELHGGRIWVESVPGKGSTFHFTLPVRPEPALMETT